MRDSGAAGRALQAHVVERAIADDMDPAIAARLATPLLRRLRNATTRRRGASTPARAEELDRDFCLLLGEAILANGIWLHKYWSGAFAVRGEHATRHRHGCGQKLVRQDAAARHLPQRRTLWACARCASVGETPFGIDLPPLRYRRGRLLIELDRWDRAPQTFWMTCSVEGIGDRREQAAALRRIDRSTAASTLRVALAPRDAHRGLRWVAAAFVWRGQFAVARVPVFDLMARSLDPRAR